MDLEWALLGAGTYSRCGMGVLAGSFSSSKQSMLDQGKLESSRFVDGE